MKTTEGSEQTKWAIDPAHSDIGFKVRHLMIAHIVTGKINRSDWGLIWNSATESSGLMVGDEVAISCEVELTRIGQKVLTMHLV